MIARAIRYIKRIGTAVVGYGQQMQFQSPQNCLPIPSSGFGVVLTDNKGNNITVKGFLFTADGQLNVLTTGGYTVQFASGTWLLNVQHTLDIAQFLTGTTAVGYYFW